MDADWDELSIAQHVGPLHAAQPIPLSALAFDNSQELLWIGSPHGRVLSLFGRELERYTSYIGHPREHVKQVLFHEKGVLTLSSHSLHLAMRRGPAIWHLTHPSLVDMQCMSYTLKAPNEIVIAGLTDQMLKVDIERGRVIEHVPLPAEDGKYVIMKRAGQHICAANLSGAVHILDSVSLKLVKSWQAHSSRICDMDATADFLVTCGLSQRKQLGLLPDPLVKVFDLKSLTPLPLVPFHPGAAFVRMHPKMHTTGIIASQTGHLQIVDLVNHHTFHLKQVPLYENNFLTGLEIAPSGEALALASSSCQVHLWGSPAKVKFTEFTKPTEFPDSVANDTLVPWSDQVPLSSVGMPYYRDVLLSAWPPQVCEVGLLPPKITPEMMAVMKRGELGLFGPNTVKSHLNQVDYTRLEDDIVVKAQAPKFLSERARTESTSEQVQVPVDVLGSIDQVASDLSDKKKTPDIYRKVEIKYSQFGIDDFDFEFYNETEYSGLETHITNCYLNPLLQLYRFTPVIRNIALYHTAMSCLEGDCMLCELGFLIDMLEKAKGNPCQASKCKNCQDTNGKGCQMAKGKNCQATNFLRTFGSLQSVISQNLLEDSSTSSCIAAMIQKVNRLLLSKFLEDFRILTPSIPYFEHVFATQLAATVKCDNCKNEQMRPEAPLLHNLQYSLKNSLRQPVPSGSKITFSQVLKASVENSHHSRGWCTSCRRYQQLNHVRHIQSMPATLMLNADIQTADAERIWTTPNWLPHEIGVVIDKGQLRCYQDEELQSQSQSGTLPLQIYELIGVVAEIVDLETKKPNLVSLINVTPSWPKAALLDKWYAFNDFTVKEITRDEALTFDSLWKLPSVLAYELKSARHNIDEKWKSSMDTSLLFTRKPPVDGQLHDSVSVLTPYQPPQSGTPVGIDAEFVSLQNAEIEIKADGSREIVRPRKLALARVSVLRGNGPSEDTPFIDDYIAQREPIVDYLTAYSGIKPGDLDPIASKHQLVTLKEIYRKLWILSNLGCVFVGHGLLNDFRTINIHVPRDQVIDTVNLWFLESRHRKLGLRFLAWLMLQEDVQSGECHDSIEDARTALHLWRRFQQIPADKVKETLDWVYKRGKELGYRAPNTGTLVRPGTGTGRDTPDLDLGMRTPASATPIRRVEVDREGFGSPLKLY